MIIYPTFFDGLLVKVWWKWRQSQAVTGNFVLECLKVFAIYPKTSTNTVTLILPKLRSPNLADLERGNVAGMSLPGEVFLGCPESGEATAPLGRSVIKGEN